MENDEWIDDPTFESDDEWVDDPSFKPEEIVSGTESFLRGGAQSGSLGLADEIYGSARGMYDDAKALFSGKSSGPAPIRDANGRVINPEQLTGTYETHRDEYRVKDK